MHIRDLVELFLTREDAEIFAKWAWGEEFRSIASGWCEIWNKRHGNKIKLLESSRPINDMPKMIELWRKKSEE